MTDLYFAQQQFVARKDRTLWHPQSGCLFLSDLHLGKGHLFRRSGIAVPDAIEHEDLGRLCTAVQQTGATTVWILGDLFHHPASINIQQLAKWATVFRSLKVGLQVILGNHDRHAEALAEELGFELNPEPTAFGSVDLAHHPDPEAIRPRIAGHIHPQVRFQRRTDRLIFPCFAIVQSHTLLLPAFTAFSGGPQFTAKDAQCYAITPDGVLSPQNPPQPSSVNKELS